MATSMAPGTILILGGSFAGISAVHYLLRHVIPALETGHGTTYNVTLVNPSEDFFWRFAAPRACVSDSFTATHKLFHPIKPVFSSYPKGSFNFIKGKATSVDARAKTVKIKTATGEEKVQPYVALVIATGFSTPFPLFTQDVNAGDLTSTWKGFQNRLSKATQVVVGGAGPVGVEVAGEIAEHLNGRQGRRVSADPRRHNAKVTLVCADNKMLPLLRASISKKAEKYLHALGAEVLYNTKVVSTSPVGEKTSSQLSDGRTLTADIYVDATGIRPNTAFLPHEWLDPRNRLMCNPKTLRVDLAGPFVYTVGDVASYTRGGVMDMYDAVPVAMTNLRTDLIAQAKGTLPGPDRYYYPNLREQQICPIGTRKGVGAFSGWKVPSPVVWAIKGRDYMTGMLASQILNGDPFKREGKWKKNPVVHPQMAGVSTG